MKKMIGFLVMIFALMQIQDLRAADPDSGNTSLTNPDDKKVEVYYFHYTRRCATCMAVESETEKALKENFQQQMNDGNITFLSVNIEEESNAPLVESMKISGQTLLFISGDRQEDLTNDAFLNARTKPEKFRQQVKDTVEQMIE